MHIAAKYGHFLIVKYLKELGANLLITNKEGMTPFDCAEDSRKQMFKSVSKGGVTLAKGAGKLGGARP